PPPPLPPRIPRHRHRQRRRLPTHPRCLILRRANIRMSTAMATSQTSSVTLPASVLRTAKRLPKREKRSVPDIVADALQQYEAAQPSKHPETPQEWALFMEEAKKTPLTQEEFDAEEKELAEFGAAQAKRLGIKSDRDIFRI